MQSYPQSDQLLTTVYDGGVDAYGEPVSTPTSTVTHDSRLIRVMSALLCEPWLISPTMHSTLLDIVRSHSQTPAVAHAKAATMEKNPQKRAFSLVGDVAVIPVEGVIGRKFSSALYSSGVTSIDVFQRILSSAVMDEEVSSIVLAFDSPGGMAMGTPEAAEDVRKAASVKPVVAYADGLMDSAAYWIASQANHISAMPSADIGSIGAYMAILDKSQMAAMQGIRVELFRSGKFKGMGMPGTTLSDEQRDMLQREVDGIAAKFKSAVLSGRAKNIPDSAMQGQSFTAEEALRLGLIDEIGSLDSAIRDAANLATETFAGKGIWK